MAYKIREEPTPKKSLTSPPPPVPAPPAPPPQIKPAPLPERLCSLDAFRGFIMLSLAASGLGLGYLAKSSDDSLVWQIVDRDLMLRIGAHFSHPEYQSNFEPGSDDPRVGTPWTRVAVSFWDLIQPAFIFMVGAAMPFSYSRRAQQGDSRVRQTLHALLRSVILVLMGVFLYSTSKSSTHWIFPNVLAQIGLGYFFVTLLLNRPTWVQWAALVAILVGTWAGIHYYPISPEWDPAAVNASYEKGHIYEPPYEQWSKNHNAFHDFDVWFLNKFPRPQELGPFVMDSGGYHTLNFIPTMGTMLLGLLCGQVLQSSRWPSRKLMWLIVAAAVCWGLGLAAAATCCPIVKRIWTPSWTLFSSGYVIGMLALFYLIFDVWGFRRLAFPLVIVGMNSILVYLIGQLSADWVVTNFNRHFGGLLDRFLGWMANSFGWLNGLNILPEDSGRVLHEAFLPVVNGVIMVTIVWLICFWLYRRKLFVKI